MNLLIVVLLDLQGFLVYFFFLKQVKNLDPKRGKRMKLRIYTKNGRVSIGRFHSISVDILLSNRNKTEETVRILVFTVGIKDELFFNFFDCLFYRFIIIFFNIDRILPLPCSHQQTVSSYPKRFSHLIPSFLNIHFTMYNLNWCLVNYIVCCLEFYLLLDRKSQLGKYFII